MRSSWTFSRNIPCCLLDTYDVHAALEKIIAMGRKPRGVRLDSGDLGADSTWVRRRLDENGWGDVEIFMSGDLDEERISLTARRGRSRGYLWRRHFALDFGRCAVAGRALQTGGSGTRRRGAGGRQVQATKVTYPGRKQVYRQTDSAGNYAGDVIALEDESMPGEPLLIPMMREGKRVSPAVSLKESQRRCQTQSEHLPALYAGWRSPTLLTLCGIARASRPCWKQVRERTMRPVAR